MKITICHNFNYMELFLWVHNKSLQKALCREYDDILRPRRSLNAAPSQQLLACHLKKKEKCTHFQVPEKFSMLKC